MSTKAKLQPAASPSRTRGADSTRAIIARSRPQDYDGHTEFARMSPAERLAWLDAAIVLVESRRGRTGRKAGEPEVSRWMTDAGKPEGQRRQKV